MEFLPPPLQEVDIPDLFSPSALGTAPECTLRFVLASQRSVDPGERLPPGPEATIGTLFHRVMERAAKGECLNATTIFDEEYQAACEALSRDARRRHFANVASTKVPLEWKKLRAWVISRAERIRPDPRLADSLTPRPARRTTGAEIALQSQTLRLRGTADAIQRVATNCFVIRDYKTGATRDEDGNIKRGIVLQLQAYGLLLRERYPTASIRLLVDDGSDHDVPFDRDAEQAARKAISGIIGRLPRAGKTDALALASVGSACFGCPVRHRCPAYQEIAPTWWSRYPNDIKRVPNDLWGEVISVLEAETISVVLRDAASRKVRVDRLSNRHGITKESVGSRLFFFALESSVPWRGLGGNRCHSRSFHEIARDRMERTAWAMQVFAGAVPAS